MNINKPNKINFKKTVSSLGNSPKKGKTQDGIYKKNQTCYSENNKLIIIATLSF